MIFKGESGVGPFDEAFDWVIVGSGASGATAARVLADTGASVAVLEEGPAVRTEEFGDKLWPGLRKMFRGAGAQLAVGKAFIPVIQGSCLGGSTVVNSAIVWRLPDDVWEPWKAKFGLGDALPLAELHKQWDVIEEELAVAPTPEDAWGGNNRLMDDARRRLKVSALPTTRNVKACRGSGRCLTGCPHGAKQSMLVTYLPYAEKRGATIVTGARVERVLFDGDRAAGVEGKFNDRMANRDIGRFRVTARKGVLVGASAIQTPQLLQRSGIRNSHLGRHFQAHPGCAMVGVFDQEVGIWKGATQGYEADEFRQSGRFKVETIALPPEMLFARMPGVGSAWLKNMSKASRAVVWAVQMRAWAEGTVRRGLFGADIRYDLTPADMNILRKGLKFTAELMFAAGAREILTGIHGLPERLTSPDQVRLIEEGPTDPRCYSFILSHLFGTARMSREPADGVVGTDFAVHGTKGLYVIDSSLFPTNTSVNPQHTIMAVAMHATKRIAGAQ